MNRQSPLTLVAAGLFLLGSMTSDGLAQTAQQPTVKIPDAGVPEIMTMEGAFVRAAYNNEGYVILGYRLANNSIGEPWILLDVGMTVRSDVPNYTLTREHISLDTPDGKRVPLPSNERFLEANLRALENRAKVTRDSINYFPPEARQACRIGFFAELTQASVRAYDQVELSSMRGCVGRLYFPVEGGISYGQHWLNVKFQQTLLRVPFRILTKDEEKLLNKNYKSISKQVKEAFKPKKK